MPRITRDEMFLSMALALSKRSTCARRQCGCLLVNKRYRVVGHGYNGVVNKAPHCIDEPCPGAKLPSGSGLEHCQAVHAEMNALLMCEATEVYTAYITASPCVFCVRPLLNTNCVRIVFLQEYPHTQAQEEWYRRRSKRLLIPNCRPDDEGLPSWHHYKEPLP